MPNEIIIKNARVHNLKNISLHFPKQQLIALCGVSGSGKSSFAMQILQKESQRQYLESMGILNDGLNATLVDTIEGLSPSIAIAQKVLSSNPRSTLGTYTEIFTFLRLLYAHLATRVCIHCGKDIAQPIETTLEIDAKQLTCPHCKQKLSPFNMASFSFNKKEGACEHCAGLGKVNEIDYSQLIDPEKTIAQGAFYLWNAEMFGEHYAKVLKKCGEHYGFHFAVDKKVKQYSELERLVFYYGVNHPSFIAQFPNIKKPRRVADGYVEGIKTYIEKKVSGVEDKQSLPSVLRNAIIQQICPVCQGSRLGFDGRSAHLRGYTINQVTTMNLVQLQNFIHSIEYTIQDDRQALVKSIVFDLNKRLHSVLEMGLGYLSLNRVMSTLSGGESQRVRLSRILESGLSGVLYILDEPTTGLHAKDTHTMVEALRRLRDLGNTVIVVEHDMDFIRQCDYIIEFGPQAGTKGGEVVFNGPIHDFIHKSQTVTAQCLNTKLTVQQTRKQAHAYLHINNAYAHNLKHIHTQIPLHQLVCFSGVSGSGKSSLVMDVIANYLQNKQGKVDEIHSDHDIQQVICMDQQAMGTMNRSNIATYSEVYIHIRQFFAQLDQAKINKLTPASFSFNVKGGRCEKCQGLGVLALNLQFLEDVEVLCPVCEGQRFKQKVLQVKTEGKHISDVLNMSVHQALLFFEKQPAIYEKLKVLEEVGLGYVSLGQTTSTLSGGECQRLKLAKYLAKTNANHTLFILDEPTTGLHPSNIKDLLLLLTKLVQLNHSVFVIEHALEVIAQSDYIVELGIGAGDCGGEIIAMGTPFEIAQNPKSITGQYL